MRVLLSSACYLGDHEYKCLEEMLTQQLLLLDKVSANSSDELRSARKALVKEVQELLEILEKRATGATPTSTEWERRTRYGNGVHLFVYLTSNVILCDVKWNLCFVGVLIINMGRFLGIKSVKIPPPGFISVDDRSFKRAEIKCGLRLFW